MTEETMDCTRIDLLIGLLEDELDADERVSVESHLEGCADCRETLEAYRSTSSSLSELEPPRPSEEARGKAYAAVMAAMGQADDEETETETAEPQSAAPTAAPEPSGEVAPTKGGQIIPFLRFVAAAAVLLVVASLFLPKDDAASRLGAAKESGPAPMADEASPDPAPSPADARLAPTKPTATAETGEAEATFVASEGAGSAEVDAPAAEEKRDGLAERRQQAALEAERQEQARRTAEARRVDLERLRESVRKETGKKAEELKGSRATAVPPAPARPETPSGPADGFEPAKAKDQPGGRLADADGAPADDMADEDGEAAGADAPAEAAPLAESEKAEAFDGTDSADAAPEAEEDDAEGRRESGAPGRDQGFGEPAPRGGGGALAKRSDEPQAAREKLSGEPRAAWTVASANGRRVYSLLASGGFAYSDLPAQPGDARAARELVVPTVRPLAQRTAEAKGARQKADPGRDLRVAEDLLAILNAEMRPTAVLTKDRKARSRSKKTLSSPERETVVALLRVLGEKPQAGDDFTRLDALRRQLVRDHRNALRRVKLKSAAGVDEMADEAPVERR